MITIEQFIKARTDLGLSQNAFAKKLGVDQSTVWAWERNGLPKNTLILESLERRIALLRSEPEQAA